MKGMWNVLERAGLVRQEDGESPPGAARAPAAGDTLQFDEPLEFASTTADADPAASAAPAALAEVSGLSLAQIYANASLPQSPYPAERLLRLLDGLKAMDEGTRRQAIQAMDAADDSWTIADPIRDATAKVSAIEAHASAVRGGLSRAESQTRAENEKRRQQHEAAVADIRRQISELEGLLSREIARSAQEAATLEAAFQAKVESAARELGTLSRVSSEFRALIAQFSAAPAPSTPTN